MIINTPSTSTPASSISRAMFEQNDSVNSAELEAKSLGDILRNSPAASLLGLPEESLPEEDDAVPTPEETAEEDPETAEDADNDLDEEADTNDEGDEATEDDENSTQGDAELPTEEDIDWDYKVPVSIDGETKYLTLREIRKGYAVDQHLSQKGREIGELKKQIESERAEKLKELVSISSVLHQDLLTQENELSSEYAALSKQIDDAREIGDTFTARELKEKREAIQEKYWKVRNGREEKIQKVASEFKKQEEQQQKLMLEEFSKNIKDIVPDFNDKVATSIREFAIKEGIPEELLGQIYSPAVVKFINDYRVLKTTADKGSVKRKQAPSKSIPTKRGTPSTVQAQKQAQGLRSKALTGNATGQEQLDFLKGISKLSKKL